MIFMRDCYVRTTKCFSLIYWLGYSSCRLWVVFANDIHDDGTYQGEEERLSGSTWNKRIKNLVPLPRIDRTFSGSILNDTLMVKYNCCSMRTILSQSMGNKFNIYKFMNTINKVKFYLQKVLYMYACCFQNISLQVQFHLSLQMMLSSFSPQPRANYP